MTDSSSTFRYSGILEVSLLISLKNGHLTAISPISISQSINFKVDKYSIIGYVSDSLSSFESAWRANLWAFIIATGDSFTRDLPYIIIFTPSRYKDPIKGTISSARASLHFQSPKESSGRILFCR